MKRALAVLIVNSIALGLCVHVVAEEADPTLDFLVILKGEKLYLPDSQDNPLGWARVLFDISDIEEYSLETHTIRLKRESAARIKGLPWWRAIERKAGWRLFHLRIDGEVIYSGLMFSNYNSSIPSPGPVVRYPLFWFGDKRSLNIGLQTQGMGLTTTPADLVDHRSDERIVGALRTAGVLIE